MLSLLLTWQLLLLHCPIYGTILVHQMSSVAAYAAAVAAASVLRVMTGMQTTHPHLCLIPAFTFPLLRRDISPAVNMKVHHVGEADICNSQLGCIQNFRPAVQCL